MVQGARVSDMAGDKKVWDAADPQEEERYRAIIKSRVDNSPFYRHMGLEVTGLGRGWATMRMPGGRHLLNVGGIVHGGAISSIADAAAGVALATLLDKDRERPVTVEMKLNYCAPVVDSDLSARGTVVQKGSRIAICEVEVSDDEGALVAKGLATFMVAGRE